MKTVLYLTALLSVCLHAAEWIPVSDGPGAKVEQLLATDSNLFALTETGIWKRPKGGDWHPYYQPADKVFSFLTDDTVALVSVVGPKNQDSIGLSRTSLDGGLSWGQVKYMPHNVSAFAKFGSLYIGTSDYRYLHDYGPHVDSRCCNNRSDFHVSSKPAEYWEFRHEIYDEYYRYATVTTTTLAVIGDRIIALLFNINGASRVGTLYNSADTGRSWLPLPKPASVTSVNQLVKVGTRIYMEADSGKFFSSSDGGELWDSLGNPAGMPLGYVVMASADGRAMFAHADKVYALEPDSSAWAGIDTQAVPAGVNCMVIFEGKLWVGTGAGLYTYSPGEVPTGIGTGVKPALRVQNRAMRDPKTPTLILMPDDARRGMNGRIRK